MVDESVDNKVNGTNGDHSKSSLSTTATSEEKAQWQGFCELESEPVRRIDIEYLEQA